MKPIKMDATARTPAVAFDFAANRFALSGESYPEDVREFFDPLLDPFRTHLEETSGADIRFEVRLTYFNSASSRILLEFIDGLDDAAKRGNSVEIVWT